VNRGVGGPPAGTRASRGHAGAVEVVVLSWPVGKGEPDPMALLSEAEREVAALLLAGHDRARIAEWRGTSRRTVDKQIERLYRKLGVGSRSELVSRLCRP